MYKTALACILMVLLGPLAARGQNQVLLVTYGPDAPTIEGDVDKHQIIFFEVPATITEPLFVRLFDPDIGDDVDILYGPLDTEHRFSLYGGDGTYTAPGLTNRERPETSLYAGTLLAQQTFGRDQGPNNRWYTLSRIIPADGEAIGDKVYFKLLIEGITGNDANLFDVALSIDSLQNHPPPDTRTLIYAPTIHMGRRGEVSELRFDAPVTGTAVTAHSFDAANAPVRVETAFRPITIASSGQGEWQTETVQLEPYELDQPLALSLTNTGNEVPNDVTLFVADATGQGLPFSLPFHLLTGNNRRPAINITRALQPDCATYSFDASASRDPDLDALRFSWDLGDGSTSDDPALRHRYQSPGTYPVVLLVSDNSGQVGNGAMERFTIKINEAPTPVIRTSDAVVAPGQTMTFHADGSTDPDGQILGYAWNFGNGNTGQGVQATHAFQQPGRYRVTLDVTDDGEAPCNTASVVETVWVNAAPIALAGNDLQAATGEALQVDAGESYDPDGTITRYVWDFGDGTQGEGRSVEHIYQTRGLYTVTLTVEDDADVSNSSHSDQFEVFVNDPPVPVVGPDRKAAIDEPITFDGSASHDPDGRIISYVWEFGDGGRINNVSATHAYQQAGTYEVVLTVRDNSGTSSSIVRDALLVTINAPPTAHAGDDQIVTSTEVLFDASRSSDPDGSIATYTWDFGDGNTGTGRAPVHAYSRPGTYRVSLTVADDSGTIRNEAAAEVIIIVNALPIADAGVDQIGAPDQTMRFDGSRSFDPDGDVVAYTWDFGDGNTGSGPQAEHTYATPGTYTVRLMVGDDTRHDNAIDYDEATVVINASPVAKAGSDVLAAPGDAIVLDASRSFDLDGQINTYTWRFSDGNGIANTAQARRTFNAPGIYTATLSVTDNSGALNATTQDQLTIHINHPPEAVAGQHVFTCEGTVTLDAAASTDADGHPLTYTWDFGDGTQATGRNPTHAYPEGGTYPVLLTVDDGTQLGNAQDVSSLTVTVNRLPVAEAGASQSVCGGDVVLFDAGDSFDPEGGTLKYQWDFGDGTEAEGLNPTKIYKDGGTYPVTLTIKDDSGFQCNTSQDRLVVSVAESPVALAGNDIQACANTEVHFDGSGSRDADGVVNRYSWDFGDGETGGGVSPVHIFTESGSYRVMLTIEGDDNGQCDNTDTDEVVVTVLDAPVAVFTTRDSAPVGVPVAFDGTDSATSAGTIVSWMWDFGDGATDSTATTEHTYAEPGRYIVTLTVTTEGGNDACNTNVMQQQIIINAPPVADAGRNQVVGVRDEVIFNGMGSRDPDGAITSWEWAFGDDSTATGAEVRHRYAQPGTYTVNLSVADNADLENSRDDTSISVVVNDPPQPAISMPAQVCPSQPVSFDASPSTDADGTLTNYAWNFGNGQTADGQTAQHAFDTPGTYQITLTVADNANVSNSTRQTTEVLTVNQTPRAEAGPDQRTCPGTTISFDAGASTDPEGAISR